MKNRFYTKSQKEQNKILILIALLSLTVIFSSIIISIYLGIYLFGILAFAIILSIIAPFFDTPSMRKTGKIIYYSPLFLTEKEKNGLIIIHGGTLFDYYFVLDKNLNGKQRTEFIIQQYLIGLLTFIEKHENNKKIKIRGTSYIINERTAGKIGFQIVDTDFSQKIILTFNYFNILISNSFAKKKLSFPNLRNIKTFEADINKLLEKKEYIERLNQSLKTSSTALQNESKNPRQTEI